MRVPSLLLVALSVSMVPIGAACGSNKNAPIPPKSASSAGGSTATSTSGAGGAGGAGGTIDHGMPSDVYPAFHPTTPTIKKLAGKVMAAPKVVPVFFANDDPTITGAAADFYTKVGATPYWAANTAEYGVGPLASGTPVHSAEMPHGTLDDTDVEGWLSAKLNGGDLAFGTPDENTIYVIVYPAGATLTENGGTGCVDFGAYHSSVKLDAAHGSAAGRTSKRSPSTTRAPRRPPARRISIPRPCCPTTT